MPCMKVFNLLALLVSIDLLYFFFCESLLPTCSPWMGRIACSFACLVLEYSIDLLYWYKSTNTEAEGLADAPYDILLPQTYADVC